jgi:hypothetical protein
MANKRRLNVNRDENGKIKRNTYNSLSENWAPTAIKRCLDAGMCSPFDIWITALITDKGESHKSHGVALIDLYNVGKWYAKEMRQYLNSIDAPRVKSPSFMRVSATTGSTAIECNHIVREFQRICSSRHRSLLDAACIDGLHTLRVDQNDLLHALHNLYQFRRAASIPRGSFAALRHKNA